MNIILTNVSASRKTHFLYCSRFQQCNLVNVIPSSGRAKSAKCAASFESSTSTLTTWANTEARRSLDANEIITNNIINKNRYLKTIQWIYRTYCIMGVTLGVTIMTIGCLVPTFCREWANTRAPKQYASLVANVTQAVCSETIKIT